MFGGTKTIRGHMTNLRLAGGRIGPGIGRAGAVRKNAKGGLVLWAGIVALGFGRKRMHARYSRGRELGETLHHTVLGVDMGASDEVRKLKIW